MPTIKEILEEEQKREEGWVVLFLEGKFWRAYERSAYALVRQYNFKPSKRFVKLVEKEIICVGFPLEQLGKYLPNAVVEPMKKRCRAKFPCPTEGFAEWKAGTRLKEPMPKKKMELYIPEEWKVKPQVMKEENLPVFKLVYDLLLRLVHEVGKMSKDFRYTLGEDVKRLLVRVEVCIYHANDKKGTSNKVECINEALEKMLEVKLYVRIMHDSKQLSLQKYALLCEQMVEVETQLKNWKQYHQQLKKTPTTLFDVPNE